MGYLNLLNDVKKRLSFEGAAELDKFVASPAIKEIVERDEVRELDKRRALIVEMAALPAKSEKLRAAAAETASKAEARLSDARAEFHAATEAHSAAFNCAYGSAASAQGDVYRIQKILGAGADPRLQHFIDAVNWLNNSFVRHACVTWPTEQKNWVTNEITTIFDSNIVVIRELMATMRAAISEAQEMQMAAVSWAEVTALIRGWLARINPGLKSLGIDIVTLGDDDSIKVQKHLPTLEVLDNVVLQAGGFGRKVLK